jgi:hypothetical protein
MILPFLSENILELVNFLLVGELRHMLLVGEKHYLLDDTRVFFSLQIANHRESLEL